MHWPLYLALKQLFPTGRRFPFFTVISSLGGALGVAVLIITVSVMGGFGRELGKMMISTQGEVEVRSFGRMPDAEIAIDAISKVEGVVACTAFAEDVVMLQSDTTRAFPAIRGVDLARVEKVAPLSQFIIAGSFDDLDDDRVILSSRLARTVGARVGSKVSVYAPRLLEKLNGSEVVLPHELEVCAIFEIGHQQLDSSLMVVTLRAMQDISGLGHSVDGIHVKIAEGLDPDVIASRINRVLPVDGMAKSWMDLNQEFLFVLQFEKNMFFLLMLCILVVASFLVVSGLMVTVVRKTREIGLLGALGGSPRQIAACFCYQGIIIGVLGTSLGLLIGFGVIHFRNDILAAFTKLTASQEALERFYQFSQLPAYLSNKDLVMIIACSLMVSTLAGILPAWRAAKLKPVEALRAE